ncbi:hypothetical protein ACFL2T_01365 [Elusimicrobiota bacterium]
MSLHPIPGRPLASVLAVILALAPAQPAAAQVISVPVGTTAGGSAAAASIGSLAGPVNTGSAAAPASVSLGTTLPGMRSVSPNLPESAIPGPVSPSVSAARTRGRVPAALPATEAKTAPPAAAASAWGRYHRRPSGLHGVLNRDQVDEFAKDLPEPLRMRLETFLRQSGEIFVAGNAGSIFSGPQEFASIDLRGDRFQLYMSKSFYSAPQGRKEELISHELDHYFRLKRMVGKLKSKGIPLERAQRTVWNRAILDKSPGTAHFHNHLERNALQAEKKNGVVRKLHFYTLYTNPQGEKQFEKIEDVDIPAEFNFYPEMEAIRVLLPEIGGPGGVTYNGQHTGADAIRTLHEKTIHPDIPGLIDDAVIRGIGLVRHVFRHQVAKVFRDNPDPVERAQALAELKLRLNGMLGDHILADGWTRFASHVDHSHIFHIIKPLMMVRLKRHRVRNKDLWDGSYLDALIAQADAKAAPKKLFGPKTSGRSGVIADAAEGTQFIPGSVFDWKPVEDSPGHGIAPLDALIRWFLDRKDNRFEAGFLFSNVKSREDARIFLYGEKHTDKAVIRDNYDRLVKDIRPGEPATILIEAYLGPTLFGTEAVRFLERKGLDQDKLEAAGISPADIIIEGWDESYIYEKATIPELRYSMAVHGINQLLYSEQKGLAYYSQLYRSAVEAYKLWKTTRKAAITDRNVVLDDSLARAIRNMRKTGGTVHLITGTEHLLENPLTAEWPITGGPRLRKALAKTLGETPYWISRPDVRKPAGPGSTLPEPSLDRLRSLTDENGIFEHASEQDPAKVHGYCTEDVARALTAALMYLKQGYHDQGTAAKLSRTYMSYLTRNQEADGRFRHRMDARGRLSDRFVTEDAYGRALWGLGYATAYPLDAGMREEAARMIEKALPHGRELQAPRAAAYAVLGLHYYLKSVPDAAEARRSLIAHSDSLVRLFQENSSRDWAWFEDEMTYDNAKLPQALLLAYETTGRKVYLDVAERALDFLVKASFRNDVLHIIGNKGWYRRDGKRADFDQQPTDAASFVETLNLAYRIIGKQSYLRQARVAFDWFLGRNALNAQIYDPSTGGSRDGLKGRNPASCS